MVVSEANQVDAVTVTGDAVRIDRSETREMRFRTPEGTVLMVPPVPPRRAFLVPEHDQSSAEAAGWSEIPKLEDGPYGFAAHGDELTVTQPGARDPWIVPLSQVEKVGFKQNDSTKTAGVVAGSVLGAAALVGLTVLVLSAAPMSHR